MEDEVDLTTLCMPIRSSGARGMLWVDLPVLRMSRSTLIPVMLSTIWGRVDYDSTPTNARVHAG